MKFKNVSTSLSSIITIPKGFQMQLSDTPEEHLEQVAKYEILKEQKRRKIGRVPKKSNALPGFNPSELINRRAVHTERALRSYKNFGLKGFIHPVFREENFHGCSDDVYYQLEPALRLSTRLLLSKGTSSFWHTLMFGKREFCVSTSARKNQNCYRIRSDTSWTEEWANAFKERLDKFAGQVHFFFHTTPMQNYGSYASMGLVEDCGFAQALQIDQSEQKFERSKICLHSDFYTTAKRISMLKYPDFAAVLRFHFFLAVVLCHEVAHSLEYAMHPGHISEVYYYSDDWNEAGEAFERKVFGGRIQPISSRIDCAYGIATIDWPIKNLESQDNVYHAVPMEFIMSLQQQALWDEAEKTSDPAVFQIPRQGAKSAELIGVDMMVWSDEAKASLSDETEKADTILKRTVDGRIVKNCTRGTMKGSRRGKIKGGIPRKKAGQV